MRGVQARISAASVLFAFVYAAATVVWLGVTGPAGRHVALVPLYLATVSVASALMGGVANQVTWLRAWLAAPAYYYALHPRLFGWLVGVVALGAVTDLLDGLAARRLHEESQFGGALDPVVDGLFYGAVALGLWLSGLVPSWLAGVVVLRYAAPAAAGGALLAARRRPELRHTVFGQLSTTVIGVCLGGAALLRATGRDPTPLVAFGYFAIPITALLTFANLLQGRLRRPSRVDSPWPR